MLHHETLEKEEATRLVTIANLVNGQLAARGIDATTASVRDWLWDLDLSILYPEFGLSSADSLVATDCPGVNSLELLRFFDRIIVRVDPVASLEDFKKVYFMSPSKMASLIEAGYFLPLRTAHFRKYSKLYDPIFNTGHVPQNSRLLFIVNVLRSRGVVSESPVYEIHERTIRAGKRWGEVDLKKRFLGNIKRLHSFGFEEIASDLLEIEYFETADTLAFNLANLLCRPFTDAVRRFSCESGTRLATLRERLTEHQRPIDSNDVSPDLVFKLDGPRFEVEDLQRLITGEVDQLEARGRLEVAGQKLWDLLNALILPLDARLKVRSTLARGSVEDAAGRAVDYRGRQAIQRLLLENGKTLRSWPVQNRGTGFW